MKKFSIMLMAALALGFTSCDDESEAIPQSNPQEPIMSAEGLTVAPGESVLAGEIDLAALNEAAQNVAAIAVTEVKDLPAGNDLKFVMQLAADENFSKTENVAVSYENNVGYVAPADWQAAHLAVFGRSPKAKTAYIRFAAYVVKGASEVRLGNPDLYYGASSVVVTPFPSDLVLEEAYYLVGTACDWSVANAIKFNHSSASVYDDPVFTLKVDISADQAAAGWWWKIVPESTFLNGDWADGQYSQFGPAVNGETALEGFIGPKTVNEDGTMNDPGAGCINEEGQWLLTIDMEAGTYAFTSAVDYLYTPGDANGWNPANSCMLFTSDYANYMGYAVCSPSGFKFTNAPDWDHVNYGPGAEAGTLSTDPNAGNLMVDALGLYWCNVNTANLTYSVANVATIGVVGDAIGSWDVDVDLTPSEDFLTWTGTVTFLEAGEWKFRANDGWDINLGGNLDDLSQGGGNLATPGAGTYEVVLYLGSLPYFATVDAK